MLEYLIDKNLIVGDEIETAENIIRYFRKQKTISCAMDYEKIKTMGGKQDPNWEEIIESQRNWHELEDILQDRASIIEKYLCVEKDIKTIKIDLGAKFYNIVNEIVLIISVLTRRRLSDYQLIILELNKKVAEYGFIKTCKKVKLNYRTLQKILDGKKNVNLGNIEKLLIFFNINNIYR